MEGEMNMLLCLYNLLTGSLVSVLRVQVLFPNRYALLLRRRCALYSVCLNYEIPFKPYNERRFWVRRGRTFFSNSYTVGQFVLLFVCMPILNDISNINIFQISRRRIVFI